MRSLAVAAALTLAVAGAHVIDLSERAAAVREFTRSQALDLGQIGRYEPREAATCAWRGTGDREGLVRAIITVESLATPRIETWWKAGVVHVAEPLGLGLPDLTYGPGRLRLSTAVAAVRADGATRGTAMATDAVVAARLLDYCETKRIVASVVAGILDSRAPGASGRSRLDLAAVRTVARIYNGQAEPRTPEAAVAHATYNALVYALFQRYRFEDLAD
jgi:hypothetical protein